MTVDDLVRNTIERRISPLGEEQRRSRKEIEEVKFDIRDRLSDGLYDIFGEEHIVNSDEAIEECWEQTLEHDIDTLFEHFEIEDYDRDSVPSCCERCISNMTEELNRIVEYYKRQDESQYDEQFKEIY